jgi:membrane-bound ClpP family serine protease
LVLEVLIMLINSRVLSMVPTYSDDGMCQFILVIRGLHTLLDGRKANFDIRRSQVGLTTLAEWIIQLYFHSISHTDVRPCTLGIRHANKTGREALKRARGKDIEVIDEEEDIGTVSGGGDILRRYGNASNGQK